MDSNGFKAINDTFGHQTGDDAIKSMGRAAREAMDEAVGSDNGKLWRAGGDEFTAHVPDHESAAKFIRAYQTKLDAIPKVGGTHKLSMSFGLGTNPEQADQALFEAKKQKYTPETSHLPERQRVKVFDEGNVPHLAHSLVPGNEGPIKLDIQTPQLPSIAHIPKPKLASAETKATLSPAA